MSELALKAKPFSSWYRNFTGFREDRITGETLLIPFEDVLKERKKLVDKINVDIAAWESKVKYGTTIDADVYGYTIEYTKEILKLLK